MAQLTTGSITCGARPVKRAPSLWLRLAPWAALRLWAQGRIDAKRELAVEPAEAATAGGSALGATEPAAVGAAEPAGAAAQGSPFINREFERDNLYCADNLLRLEEKVGVLRAELSYLERQSTLLQQRIALGEQDVAQRRARFDSGKPIARGPGEQSLSDELLACRRRASDEQLLAPIIKEIDDAQSRLVEVRTRIDKLVSIIEQTEKHSRYIRERRKRRTALRIAAYNQSRASRIRRIARTSSVRITDSLANKSIDWSVS